MLNVEKALGYYLKEHVLLKSIDKRRIEYATEALNRHLAANIGDIDIPACRRYTELREGEGVRGSTIRYELGILRAAANHALKWRRIKQDDMPTIERPCSSPPRPVWLTKEQLGRLGKSSALVSERIHRFVVLAYYTAARKTTVEALQWDQFDWNTGRIALQHFGSIATNKRRPVVPIFPEIRERLETWHAAATTKFVLGDPSDTRYEFEKATKLADLEILPSTQFQAGGKVTPHALRHSRATHLLQDNKSPYAVANLLGDNLQTVLRTYAHACPDNMESRLAGLTDL